MHQHTTNERGNYQKHMKWQTFPVATLYLCQAPSVSLQLQNQTVKTDGSAALGSLEEMFISADRWIQEHCLSVLRRPDRKYIRNGQDAQH